MFKKGDKIFILAKNSGFSGYAIFDRDCPIFPGQIGFFFRQDTGQNTNAHYYNMIPEEIYNSPLFKALQEE